MCQHTPIATQVGFCEEGVGGVVCVIISADACDAGGRDPST